ncbi:mobilization protein, partial [Shigella flexneri]|nr:mobilization protein [Shigella flexneri]
LLERCEGKQLAVWMRRVCLGEPVARSGKLPTLAPPLLRQLAAIGDELRRLRLAVREQGARDDS